MIIKCTCGFGRTPRLGFSKVWINQVSIGLDVLVLLVLDSLSVFRILNNQNYNPSFDLIGFVTINLKEYSLYLIFSNNKHLFTGLTTMNY